MYFLALLLFQYTRPTVSDQHLIRLAIVSYTNQSDFLIKYRQIANIGLLCIGKDDALYVVYIIVTRGQYISLGTIYLVNPQWTVVD